MILVPVQIISLSKLTASFSVIYPSHYIVLPKDGGIDNTKGLISNEGKIQSMIIFKKMKEKKAKTAKRNKKFVSASIKGKTISGGDRYEVRC